MNDKRGESQTKRQRKRSPAEDPFRVAYRDANVTSRPSTGRPGSPHRYFRDSYTVSINTSATTTTVIEESSPSEQQLHSMDTREKEEGDANKNTNKESNEVVVANINACDDSTATETHKIQSTTMEQVVHHHANGLCIITLGDSLAKAKAQHDKNKQQHDNENKDEMIISGIEFIAKKALGSSAGEKRKHQGKMLRGKSAAQQQQGVVTPATILANIRFENGQIQPIYACVWGNILELNEKVTPEQLQKDPLLGGYLAVVLPTGPFPPYPSVVSNESSIPTDGTTAINADLAVNPPEPRNMGKVN